jgi:hypothetical protein
MDATNKVDFGDTPQVQEFPRHLLESGLHGEDDDDGQDADGQGGKERAQEEDDDEEEQGAEQGRQLQMEVTNKQI